MRLGFSVWRVGADLRSRVLLFLLGLGALLKDNTRWRTTMVKVNVVMAGDKRVLYLAGRNDLAILSDILVRDEYVLPDDLHPHTILDLGAHVGIASVYLASCRPQARIVAVEANPALVTQLRRNVEPLGIRVIHAAASTDPGPISFFCGRDNWGSSTVRTTPLQVEERVPARDLPALLGELGGHADLLKMDIEGAEWDILDSGFPDNVGAMVAEAHRSGDRLPAEFMESMATAAVVEIVSDDSERGVFWARRS